MSGVISKRFKNVYILDFEFQAEDGERQKPVSLCALHYARGEDGNLRKKEDIQMFFRDGQKYECPFIGIESETNLFLGYNVSAEYKCHLIGVFLRRAFLKAVASDRR